MSWGSPASTQSKQVLIQDYRKSSPNIMPLYAFLLVLVVFCFFFNGILRLLSFLHKANFFSFPTKNIGSVWIRHLVLFPPSVFRPRWKTQLKITCLLWIMENHYSWATESRHREVQCTVTNQTWIHLPSPLKTQHNPSTTSPTLYGPTARWWMRWV